MSFRPGDLALLPPTGEKSSPKIAIIIRVISKEAGLYDGRMLWDHYRFLIHVDQRTMYVTEAQLRSIESEQ
jgi:hypothetical protein